MKIEDELFVNKSQGFAKSLVRVPVKCVPCHWRDGLDIPISETKTSNKLNYDQSFAF